MKRAIKVYIYKVRQFRDYIQGKLNYVNSMDMEAICYESTRYENGAQDVHIYDEDGLMSLHQGDKKHGETIPEKEMLMVNQGTIMVTLNDVGDVTLFSMETIMRLRAQGNFLERKNTAQLEFLLRFRENPSIHE
ncbi:hypothetical protein Tco_1367741 [Tanacetum coccineum]